MPNITFTEDSKYHTQPRYFFTDNPIDIMLFSSNMYAVLPQKGKLVLKLYKPGGMSAEGATFVLKFPGHELVFRQYDSPDESGLQVPRYQTGYFGTWVTGFFEGLASNPDLATWFTLALTDASTASPLITIEAREAGEEYDLSYTESESTIPGIYPVGSGSTYQEGVSAQRRGNYKMLCQVLNRLDDELFGSDLITPNDDGEALFRVSEYLRPNVPAPIPWPKPSEAMYELLTNNVMSFYIRFAESYDGKTYKMFDSRYYIFLAIAGGLNWYDFKRLSGLGVQYFNDTALAKRFLDWAPDILTVAPDQPVRLSYLIKYAGSYSIKRVVTFTDGSTQTLSEGITATDVAVLQLYIGHDETELATLNPAKTVKQIQVSIYNTDSTPLLVSNVRTYIFDRTPAADSEFLLWRNAFGRYQTLWLNASREEESKVEREEAELTLEYEATPDTPQYITHSHLETQTVKHATGWLSTDDADWLRDFMLSKEVYRIRRQNYLERIIIRNSKLVTHDTDDSLISLELEYQPTHRDTRRSNASTYVES